MTDTLNLEQCPFCGGKAEWLEGDDVWHQVGCVRCAGRGQENISQKTAQDAWNRRVFGSEIPGNDDLMDSLFRDISSAIMSAKETLGTMTTERKLPALSSRAVSDGWKLSRALESLSKLSDMAAPKREIRSENLRERLITAYRNISNDADHAASKRIDAIMEIVT